MTKHIRLLRAVATALMAALSAGAVTPASATQGIPGFEVFCFYSHSAKDDPIVMPGMPGKSMHLHDFAGNTSTNADSTIRSLRHSRSTCQLKADTAAYWTPTLYSHGRAVHPDRLHAYYRWGNVKDYAHIRPMPAGLKMIAGDPMSTTPQPINHVAWGCGVQGARMFDHPVSCRTGQKIVLHVFFPNCWDGTHLDSANHRSHVAYSYHGSCPRSHPVAIPRLSEDYGYPIIDARGIRLASGSWTTAHADFWNTWRQKAMRRLTRHCIDAGRQCGPQRGA